jgi:hypothetical protein
MHQMQQIQQIQQIQQPCRVERRVGSVVVDHVSRVPLVSGAVGGRLRDRLQQAIPDWARRLGWRHRLGVAVHNFAQLTIVVKKVSLSHAHTNKAQGATTTMPSTAVFTLSRTYTFEGSGCNNYYE